MPIEQMNMPQLGESVTEGTISSWLVKPGDRVNKYDPIAEVMTDKVNAEVPSSFTGVIEELIAEEGQTLPVGEVMCSIQIEGSDSGSKETTKKAKTESVAKGETSAQNDHSNRGRYSPAVLKLSQEHGINLGSVTGSGAGGRITRKDILKVIETGTDIQNPSATEKDEPKTPIQQSLKSAVSSETIKKQEPSTNDSAVENGDLAIPLTGIRKAIAQNMLRSKHEIPHAWTMIEADVTNLVQYRDSLKDEFKKREGYNLTYFAFFVKAVAQALKEFPEVNSMWAGDKIVQKKDINISIAVATDEALFVPVIKHADEKTIKGIAREINELAKKVRSGKLKSEDMQGGTFTVNNTGSFGSIQSMGIINHPQAAILQVESIVKKPVVMDGNMIAIRDRVNLCLSLDHRVLDGLVCGRFLARVKEILENITSDHTPIY